ncbi:MAG: Rrf2 family transcriptional regulator [Ignavibacteriales bacterium]|nr:Rrf2 family transcriptional regulator [Ignavibacteriales bacterium]
MQLTNTGEYALRAMLYLGSHPMGTIVPISEVSKNAIVPENFLRKIVGLLAKARVIRSVRGASGGVGLAKPPESLTMYDIIEAVEGKIYLNQCLMGSHICALSSTCAVHSIWCEAQEALKKVLTSRTLADLCALTTYTT